MTRAPVAFVVGVALGIAIGAAVAGRGGTSMPPATPIHGSAARVVLTSTSPTATAELAALAMEPGVTAPVNVSLGAAIAAIPEERFERGTGRIDGIIVDKTGAPLGGVLVRAIPPHNWVHEGDDLEECVRETVQKFRRGRALGAEMRTDERGAFALGGLAPATYSVEARLKGWSFDCTQDQDLVRPGASVRFTASRTAHVIYDVRKPGGVRASEATIFENIAGRTLHWTWWPDDADDHPEEGRRQVCATAGRFSEYASAWREVTLPLEKPDEPVVLELEGKPKIFGEVVPSAEDRGGDPTENVLLLLARVDADDAAALASLRERGRRIRFDGSTRFATDDLRPGRYIVGAARGDHRARGRIAAYEIVSFTGDPAVVTLSLPAPSADDGVRVRATDETGALLRGAQVTARAASGPALLLIRLGTDPVDFVLVPPGTTGPIEIDAIDQGHASAKATVAVGTPEVTLTLASRSEPEVARASLIVHLSGFAGSALEGDEQVRLELVSEDGSRAYNDGPVNLDGDARLSSVPVGAGDLLLFSALPEFNEQVCLARSRVTIHPGQNEATLVLPALHALLLIGPGAGSFDLAGGLGRDLGRTPHIDVSVDATGRARVVRLPPGTYTAAFRAQGAARPLAPMSFVIPGPAEIRYVPEAHDAVLVEAPGAGCAASGLAADDVIVAADGATLEGDDPIDRVRELAGTKPTLTLTVLRRGVAHEIAVAPSDLLDYARLASCNSAGTR